MKYIVITSTPRDKDSCIIRTPIIFPTSLVHEWVAKAICLVLTFLYPRHDSKVTSAGEVSLYFEDLECGGQSTSIGVKSDPDADSQLIIMNDYGAGLEPNS